MSANIEFKKNNPNQEYFLKLKKKKLIYIYSIYESLQEINREEHRIFNTNKDLKNSHYYSYIDVSFLEVKDQFLLIIISVILILYILGIISKILATVRLWLN